ncbi:MAG: hypothetical protein UV73_C0002G0076 [Candidatus Gottesmanbacteria bacterium GW2011_GWA2_43_14]|uniref:DUF5660 domain-containing protein n=1 Tax=Candidatus Gottesmanbacteria bacterium GW2011_GWA2_43_14 TaxID=1618443 RepID=A0A0G1DL97_9BACT|nr:MAG: hypothetical protein UV73_C0002G0076 [Candidatus Gottesmanbacteria bacterium GW2011_GWA2_43_14]
MFAKKSNQKINPWGDDNHEKLTQSPKSAVKKQLGDLISPSKMLDQIFGNNPSGEYYPRPSMPENQPSKPSRENLVFSYRNRSEDVKITQETQAIVNELKKQVTILEKKEKGITQELAKIKVEQLPPKTGIYYLRFLEWLLLEVKRLIVKVDEGKAWLSTFNQKKKKRMGYWKMYKKHGTTFGLSHERSLATQSG